MLNWDYDSYWQKAKVYAGRALRERRDGPLFPFWSSLALEILARATLAKVHPALLADPRGDESMLYAFGFPAKQPKSVPMATVVSRCGTLVDGFTKQEENAALLLVERRNEELHSGRPAFEDFPTSLWLTDFYRICNLLLRHQGKELADLFGPNEAEAAEKMIKEANKEVISQAKRAQGIACHDFEELEPDEQDRRREYGSLEARRLMAPQSKLMPCPSCGAQALVSGRTVTESEPRLEDDDIVKELTVLPTELRCFSCELKLARYGALQALDIGGQFGTEWRVPAIDYYAPDLDPADYYEPEYGND